MTVKHFRIVRVHLAVFSVPVGLYQGSTQCALKRQALTSRVSRTLRRAIVPMRITLIGALWSLCACYSLVTFMLNIMQQHNGLHACISTTTSFVHLEMVFHFLFNFTRYTKTFSNNVSLEQKIYPKRQHWRVQKRTRLGRS